MIFFRDLSKYIYMYLQNHTFIYTRIFMLTNTRFINAYVHMYLYKYM
jgi:hypothetical protein